MTPADRRELLICAGQADAWGRIETARWYRIWAHYGEPHGEKPEENPARSYYNAPIS